MKPIGDDQLLQQFITAFSRLDDGLIADSSSYAVEYSTPVDAVECIASRIADRLPVLYERLILTYRWPEVDLRLCRLLANAPGIDLQPLAEELFRDPVLNNTLIPARLLRFAMAVDSYDPICFDLSRSRRGDCPIVQLNHETILCEDEIGDVKLLFHSFQELVEAVISLSSD